MPPVSYTLRLSLTRACSLRCVYCHEERKPSGNGDCAALGTDELFEILSRIARSATLEKIRLTGGEPLLVPELPAFVRRLRRRFPQTELCLTTNGLALAALALPLKEAGLSRITVSLDAADPERYRRITGLDAFQNVLDGLKAAKLAGFSGLNINSVLLRTQNGDRLLEQIRLARRFDAEQRFIELMPLGPGKTLFAREHISVEEALLGLRDHYPVRIELGRRATARRLRLEGPEGAVEIGLISPVSAPFCATCNRLRLDSAGRFYTCLRQERGIELAPLLASADARMLDTRITLALADKHPLCAWPERAMQALGG